MSLRIYIYIYKLLSYSVSMVICPETYLSICCNWWSKVIGSNASESELRVN